VKKAVFIHRFFVPVYRVAELTGFVAGSFYRLCYWLLLPTLLLYFSLP